MAFAVACGGRAERIEATGSGNSERNGGGGGGAAASADSSSSTTDVPIGTRSTDSTGSGIGTRSTNSAGVPEAPVSCSEANGGCQPFELPPMTPAFYFLIDVSASMACPLDPGQVDVPEGCMGEPTRMDIVRDALLQFVNDPLQAGLEVGLGYFGEEPPGSTSCDAMSYSLPAVDFGELPSHASDLEASLAEAVPTGETPTDAALSGACNLVSEWSLTHPAEAPHIILITDDVPSAPSTSDCNPDANVAIQAATSCFDQGIETDIIALKPFSPTLSAIAAAGGTEEMVSIDEGADQLANVLRDIAATASDPCTVPLPVPASGTVDFDSIFHVCDAEGNDAPTHEASDCSAPDAWFLETRGTTSFLHACPSICEVLSEPNAFAYLAPSCGPLIF